MRVPPKALAAVRAHLMAGGTVGFRTYTRSTYIDARCWERWEKAGVSVLREEGDGYRMRLGKGSVYLLPGQLRFL